MRFLSNSVFILGIENGHSEGATMEEEEETFLLFPL